MTLPRPSDLYKQWQNEGRCVGADCAWSDGLRVLGVTSMHEHFCFDGTGAWPDTVTLGEARDELRPGSADNGANIGS